MLNIPSGSTVEVAVNVPNPVDIIDLSVTVKTVESITFEFYNATDKIDKITVSIAIFSSPFKIKVKM